MVSFPELGGALRCAGGRARRAVNDGQVPASPLWSETDMVAAAPSAHTVIGLGTEVSRSGPVETPCPGLCGVTTSRGGSLALGAAPRDGGPLGANVVPLGTFVATASELHEAVSPWVLEWGWGLWVLAALS